MKEEPDYTSRVPKYTFANTLQAQEVQLKTNPLILRFIESRKKMADDPYRPIYHFVSPESTLNDPNGLCFWQGRWHMFYQGYPPEDRRQHWGHVPTSGLLAISIYCSTIATRAAASIFWVITTRSEISLLLPTAATSTSGRQRLVVCMRHRRRLMARAASLRSST